jgi:putative FmdB family regulatory protein
MPIYAYRCSSCGFEKDVLQKMSDVTLTTCPECKMENFEKQVTAAGFQLKGSGWYVTDFKGGSKPATTDTKTEAKTEGASTPSAAPAPASTTTATTATSPAPAKTEPAAT